MKWRNVKIIWQREVRDQLRDRRTLFTIAVLPILLYPLMGTLVLQVIQFLREHPTEVAIVGREYLPESPALVTISGDKWRFSDAVASDDISQLLPVTVLTDNAPASSGEEDARAAAITGRYDAVVFFPPNFRDRLEQVVREVREGQAASEIAINDRTPQPQVFYNAASDKSKIAQDRVLRVLDRWRKEIVRRSLEVHHIPAEATEPFVVKGTDVAPQPEVRAAVWSKILPFVALIWALTGAFYPAIDVCAGEKERGTLETLLSSPAGRSEIVCGKLLTVMCFSMATSLLNLASMGFTGVFVMAQFHRASMLGGEVMIGPPPLSAAIWLTLALVPISALFSAIAVAVAALARSSKEGQYYLMPILLISLPLMIVPVLPAAELDLGKSLIPVTGVMLLLRTLIEGRFMEALPYCLPVILVTVFCCWLAIRWAIDQFNNESVLFRESERWELSLWFRQMVRERDDTPTLSEGVLCGMLILAIRFLATLAAREPKTWTDMAAMTAVLQIALIATPAMLMAMILTRSPGKTLLLRVPHPLAPVAAILLAICWNPSSTAIGSAIMQLYPPSPEIAANLNQLTKLLIDPERIGATLIMLAVLPAICEEIAFRGFILSGLRHMGRRWTAIVVSSVFFGLVHAVLQQSLSAFFTGLILGYLAVQTGSLLPCILFHATHNGLTVLRSLVTADTLDQAPILQCFLEPAKKEGYDYSLAWSLLSFALSAMLLVWFRRLPLWRTSEEKLRDAIHQQSAAAAAAR